MISFKALLAGCIFSHGNQIRERRGAKYLLICERCGEASPVLKGQKLKVKKVKAATRPSQSLRFPRRA